MTTTTSDIPRRRASVEVLRAEAADERSVLVGERLRAGEDPWDFMEDLPSIDDLVVLTLRADVLAESGGGLTTRRNLEILANIADQYPQLAPAVAGLLSHENTHRRWHAAV